MKKDENIYKNSRMNANMTQELACDLLSISLRSIARYESGEVLPPEDVVVKMCEAYKDEYLPYQYLQSNIVYNRIFPEINDKRLQDATIGLLNAIHKLTDHDGVLYDIADGSNRKDKLEELEGLVDSVIKNVIPIKIQYKKLK